MRISIANLTSKGQVTVPAWVRKALEVEPKMEIVWLEFKPGEISVMAKKPVKGNPFDQLYGVFKGKGADHVDLVQELLDDRKKDIQLAERGFNN